MTRLTENQIPLDAQEVSFRPGVQPTDCPLIVTITPERLARSIELDASTAFRDAFALAWASAGVADLSVAQQIADAQAAIIRLTDERNAWRSASQDRTHEADHLRATLSRVEAERDGLARDLALSRRIEASEDVRGWMYAHGSDGSILLAGEFASGEEFVTKYRTTPTTTEGEKP